MNNNQLEAARKGKNVVFSSFQAFLNFSNFFTYFQTKIKKYSEPVENPANTLPTAPLHASSRGRCNPAGMNVAGQT